MPSILPIKLDDLLYGRNIESARVEFKASWDEKTTGPQVIRTLCAFANDFQNLNGGYVVIGVAERNGQAQLPAKGLSVEELEAAQNWLRGRCNTIDPVYFPVMSPERHEDRLLLVLWAPGSQMRPHQAPESGEKGAARKYYIRLSADTVDAERDPALKTQLLNLTARVPFDDQRARDASVNELRETKVREFLHDIGSGLLEERDTRTLYRNLRIAEPVNGHDAPRNIGLLFFSQNPEAWFAGARIEVARFAGEAGSNVLDEHRFAHSPIHEQLRDCLSYLETLSARTIHKHDQAQATHQLSYPLLAVREALANAVYHRSYESNTPEPIKVHLYPDRMEIISYPGPVPGIDAVHLNSDKPAPPVPARNRRIGEFLKELKLAEGRGSGLPKIRRAMADNGSPPPQFDFDAEQRSYFRVTLPIHPAHLALQALQDAARLSQAGETPAPVHPESAMTPPTSLLETLQSLRYEDALSADDPRYVDTREARGSQQTLNRLAKKLGCDLKQHKFFPPASAHVLFFGHVGSGKTTELRQYARALADSGFIYIVEVDVLSRLDRNNLQYSEVLLAMAEALVERLSADGLATPAATLQPLHDWFSRVVRECESTLNQEIKAELGAGVSLGVIAKVLAKITASAKTGASYKEQWRQEVRNRFTTLAEHFNTLLRELEAQLSGLRGERLRIAFVIDGADKLRGDDTEQFFVHDAEQLLAIDAFVIYTAPLHLKYSGKLVGKLQDLVLPMIKLYERDGARCQAGWTALCELLARRINPALFAEPALMDDLIGYCGGHPRELLRLLGLCCEVADDEVIDRAVLDAAVKLLAADYRRFLSPDDYTTLAQLDAQPQHDGNTEAIQQLLYKLALLEYNDGSWRRSHPVVRELEGYRNAQQVLAQP